MVVPFDKVGNLLYVAIADPSNVYALEDLRFVTGLTIKPFVTVESVIQKILEADTEGEALIDSIIDEQFALDSMEFEEETSKEVSIETLKKEVEETPLALIR